MHAKTMTAPFLGRRSYRARPLLVLAWRAVAAWHLQARRRRAAADELRTMGELGLRDLGIGRSEIDHLLEREAPTRRR